MTATIIGIISLLAGLLHLVAGKTLERYAVNKGNLGADRSVKMSALFLIGCGVACFIPEFVDYGGYGLSLFLVLTAFVVHKFWDERDPQLRLSEGLHFLKNLALAAVVLAALITA